MVRKREKVINMEIVKYLENSKKRDISYIDALSILSREHSMDVEDMVKMIPDDIIEDIKLEFADRKIIKIKDLNDEVDRVKNISNIMDWLD